MNQFLFVALLVAIFLSMTEAKVKQAQLPSTAQTRRKFQMARVGKIRTTTCIRILFTKDVDDSAHQFLKIDNQ